MSTSTATNRDALLLILARISVKTSAVDPTSILPQPASRLLSLPTELRLLVCSYMTLSPEYTESLAFRGAYLSCRLLHQDMRNALVPEQDLVKYMASKRQLWTPAVHTNVSLGPLHPFLGLIRSLTIRIPVPTGGRWQSDCLVVLRSLYALYLDDLHVVMTGAHNNSLPYGDMKSFGPSLFMDFVRKEAVNCRKVTFTLDSLSRAEGGRAMSTVLAIHEESTNIRYHLTIVQNKEEKQVERAFKSSSRFKPECPEGGQEY
ncbi:hypothetical protein CC86DRAFT_370153 [Ophiobolus disseminans]|uniref:F-box domain-containing protein n=1 Tax=Ophiobolus disseminans TaxID=1469910 RepID=A0A6A7A2M7_9PLEO|nr:hypothetical protein CC86DRAFT_370153 [Ophiobolus disseminans]